MLGKRGQGATEYLVIFAAVLVVALIVVFILGQFVGGGSQMLIDQSRAYWEAKTPLAIQSWKFNSTHGVLVLKNTYTKKIEVLGISLDGTSVTISSPSNANLSAGETAEFIFTLPTSLSCSPAGTVKEYDLAITYKESGLTVQMTEQGTVPVRTLCE